MAESARLDSQDGGEVVDTTHKMQCLRWFSGVSSASVLAGFWSLFGGFPALRYNPDAGWPYPQGWAAALLSFQTSGTFNARLASLKTRVGNV